MKTYGRTIAITDNVTPHEDLRRVAIDRLGRAFVEWLRLAHHGGLRVDADTYKEFERPTEAGFEVGYTVQAELPSLRFRVARAIRIVLGRTF